MIRTVPLDIEQARLIEEVGKELLGAGDPRATKLLTIYLAWTYSPEALYHREFHCDVDESAGMAEVVQLQGYSRKVPCA